MRILLHDHDHVDDAPSSWAEHLTAAFGDRVECCYEDLARFSSSSAQDVGVVFVHCDGSARRWVESIERNQGWHLVFVRSGGEASGAYDGAAGGRVHYCSWSPYQPLEAVPGRWKSFVEALKTGKLQCVDWELLRKERRTDVVEAARLLCGSITDIKVHFVDYSDPDDFQKLWSFPNDDNPVVIAWSETAPDPALFPIVAGACLSPLDWAMCYAAQRMNASPGSNSTEWPRVLVLNLNPELQASVPSVAHYASLKPEQFPWLSVVSVGEHGTLPNALPIPGTFPVDEVSKRALNRFLREIRLSLTEPREGGAYDRHAVSNIIGPMILRAKAATPTLHSLALLQLLSTCGLVSPEATNANPAAAIGDRSSAPDGPISVSHPAWCPPKKQGKKKNVNPAERFADCNVLLLDDQADHGWAAWVKETLLLPDDGLKCIARPDEILDALRAQWLPNSRDCRFRLELPGLVKTSDNSRARLPILLLDLRLFSGKPRDARRFYKDLLAFIRYAKCVDRDDLAWPAFDSKDESFAAACRALDDDDSRLSESVHRQLLTWLPRVVALADMSLPIVIFSSTGRRDLIASLADCGNIITSFSKPRFTELGGEGTATDPVASSVKHFRMAVAAARRYATPRAFQAALLYPATAGSTKSQASTDGAPGAHHRVERVSAGEPWNVTVYIDESGDAPGNLRMGALVSLTIGVDQEKCVDRALVNAFSSRITTKDDLRNDRLLNDVLKTATGVGARLGYLELMAEQPIFAGTPDADDLSDEWVVDNLWRHMFVRVVECAVFGLARSMVGDGGRLTWMSVRAPTRHIPVTPSREWKLKDYWGIETIDGEDGNGRFARVFGFADARPLVQSVVQHYRGTDHVPQARVVRAFPINKIRSEPITAGRVPDLLNPVLHYAADGLVSNRNTTAVLEQCGIPVWVLRYGPEIDHLLAANRAMARGDIVQAALSMCSVSTENADSRSAFFDMLREGLRRKLACVTGTEQLSIARGWRNNRGTSQGRRLQGTVQPNGVTIIGDDGRTYYSFKRRLEGRRRVSFVLDDRKPLYPGEGITVTSVRRYSE